MDCNTKELQSLGYNAMGLKSQSHGSTRADEAEFPEAYTHTKSNCKINYTDENRIPYLITSVDHPDDCLQGEIPDNSLILC